MTTSNTGVDDSVRAELNRLRESIDNIDAAVVHMLAERFKCTQQVGVLKAEHQLPPADPAREARQITRLRQLAESARLDPAFAEKLLNFIIAEVIRHHETIADEVTHGGSAADGGTRGGSAAGDVAQGGSAADGATHDE
ncbi:chorismate mutase [Streptomyces liangshanensis]|uniref:Chorismate mutase n=1 Tax=Streptomyces liangshanensis TaxID=2717324 RepID=A0A6G9H430_9ACTN|nr:chorismate mutase [Streptomyces liangshanensis]QIQ05275.1 chorismate mutase [Streptomyces liangshanensis]